MYSIWKSGSFILLWLWGKLSSSRGKSHPEDVETWRAQSPKTNQGKEEQTNSCTYAWHMHSLKTLFFTFKYSCQTCGSHVGIQLGRQPFAILCMVLSALIVITYTLLFLPFPELQLNSWPCRFFLSLEEIIVTQTQVLS